MDLDYLSDHSITNDTDTELEDLAKYHDAIKSILSRQNGNAPGFHSRGPAKILHHLYLGDFGDANSLGQLSELGITHMLNCAGVYNGNSRSIFTGTIRSYQQLEAHDNEEYDMLNHYNEAERFIEDARKSGGKILVYCAKGVNRSAAICVAYLIAHDRMSLCSAVDIVSGSRGAVLSNPGFRKQLVMFAHQNDCLDPL